MSRGRGFSCRSFFKLGCGAGIRISVTISSGPITVSLVGSTAGSTKNSSALWHLGRCLLTWRLEIDNITNINKQVKVILS